MLASLETASGLVDQSQDLLAEGGEGTDAGDDDQDDDHGFLGELVTPSILHEAIEGLKCFVGHRILQG